jgi:hypothetical protein
MKRQIYYSIVLGGLLFSATSFAAIANCVATNAKTGQSFAADGGGPNQIRANQVAQDKALGKCHAESTGWPGQCAISQCTPN